MARILITGATGSLGQRVVLRALAAGHSVVGTRARAVTVTPDAGNDGRDAGGTDGRDAGGIDGSGAAAQPGFDLVRLDIRDLAAVRRVVAAVEPDVVIHAAAGRDRSDWPATADGAANVALACAARAGGEAGGAGGGGPRLVHVSSDAVFAGRDREYTEEDVPSPVYAYGAAKAAAETAVRAIAPGAAIVRTSLILGDGGGAHERLTHDLIAGRVDGALFTDEIRKPVHVDDLADALLELGAGAYRGVINVAGPDAVSRYELGVMVARRDGLDAGRLRSATASGRPGDVRLGIGLAARVLGTRLRGVHEFVAGGRPGIEPSRGVVEGTTLR